MRRIRFFGSEPFIFDEVEEKEGKSQNPKRYRKPKIRAKPKIDACPPLPMALFCVLSHPAVDVHSSLALDIRCQEPGLQINVMLVFENRQRVRHLNEPQEP